MTEDKTVAVRTFHVQKGFMEDWAAFNERLETEANRALKQIEQEVRRMDPRPVVEILSVQMTAIVETMIITITFKA